MVAFIQWWYGPGWRDAADRLAGRSRSIYLNFSLPVLLKTLFSPWRRIITPPGSSMQQKLRAVADNAISRAVGFTMRLSLLIAAVVLLVLNLVFGCLFLIAWPLLPALGPILIVVGLI
jgi:hypothetical protein